MEAQSVAISKHIMKLILIFDVAFTEEGYI